MTQLMPPQEQYVIVKSGGSLRLARSTLVHASHNSCLRTPTTSLATQKRLPRTHYTWYLARRIRTSDSVQVENIFYYKQNRTSSCGVERFVETHLCKLCMILRNRELRVVCSRLGYRSATPLGTQGQHIDVSQSVRGNCKTRY